MTSPTIPPPARKPGKKLSLAELRDLARSVGFPDPVLAAAVAMAESSGDPAAKRVVTTTGPDHLPERSFGLWQVNTLAHPEFDETELLDPDYNARAALLIAQGPKGWNAWSTYTSGAYLRHMGDAS